MTSTPFIFSWNVTCSPFDEADLENCHALEQENHGDYFNIKVNVKHQPYMLYSTAARTTPFSVVPFGGFSAHGWMFLTTQEFFENGGSYMAFYFPDSIVPRESIHSMMPDMITSAKNVVQSGASGFHYESPNFRLFTLVLDVFVQKLYDVRDDGIINMTMMESMTDVQMVPASKNAIESLKKVKLESGAVMERCSICLTEFDKDMEVLLMPCKHGYHNECLIKWLKTSHTCPLCRYPIPTSSID